MTLRSMMLGSVRPYYAAAGDPTGAAGDAGGSDTGTPDREAAGAAPRSEKPTVLNEAGATEGEDTGDGDAEPAARAAPTAPDPNAWKDKELGRKHRQLQKERARSERLEQELADARAIVERAQAGAAAPAAGDAEPVARQPAARQQEPAASEAEIEERVERRAAQRAAKTTYDQQCNAVAETGAKAFKDTWGKAIDTLEQLGGFDVPTMEGVLATDDPSKVLHELGSNPDEYHRIMDLPPARRQTELVKIALKAAPKKKAASDAPEPVEAVGGRGAAAGATDLKDDLNDDEWYKRRAAQKKARWDAQRGARA